MYLSKNKKSPYYQLHYTNPTTGRETKVSTKCKYKSSAYKYLLDFKDIQTKKQTGKIPIGGLLDDFLSYSKQVHTTKTYHTFRTTFKSFQSYFPSSSLLSALTVGQLENYITFRISNKSIYMARKDYINLSSWWSWLIKQGYTTVNLMKDIKRPKPPKNSPKFFTLDEFNQLLKHIKDPKFKDIVLFAVNTGCRSGEITNLNWSDIDFDSKSITISNKEDFTTKNKEFRIIPMNDTVYQLLINMEASCKFVFSFNNVKINGTTLSHKFKAAVIKAQLDTKFHFHCCRHTFASWLVQKGVSIYTVSKLLGHKSVQTTMIYAHLSRNELEKAVNNLSY